MSESNLSNRDRWRIAMNAWPLTRAQVKVALAISEFADFDKLDKAFPGVPLLVERTGLAERTVKQARADLLMLRLIRRKKRGGIIDGQRKATEYVLVIPPASTPRRTAAEVRALNAERKARYDEQKAAGGSRESEPVPSMREAMERAVREQASGPDDAR